MKARLFALIAALALSAPGLAAAQQYPQIVLDRVKMMAATCSALGGKPGNSDRPLTYQYDLTGDGKPEWLLDAAGFGCIGKPNAFRSPTGASLEVFTPTSGGRYASAYIGTVFTYRVTNAKPGKLFITLKGAACGGASKTCEKQLVWNAATKKFTPGASAPVTVAQSAPAQGAATQNAAGGFSGPSFTITAADKAAAFKAAGFKQTKRGWQSCADAEGADSPSYSPGSIVETSDLNNDGRPEIWLTEGGAMCYGMTGSRHIILAKTSAGQWKVLLDAVTFPTKLSTRTNGWLDFEDGGPGMGPWGKFRFDGSKYVLRR